MMFWVVVNADSCTLTSLRWLYRTVFDEGIDDIPSAGAPLDKLLCCDVCMRKDDRRRLAQIYCVICQKKFCTPHEKVRVWKFGMPNWDGCLRVTKYFTCNVNTLQLSHFGCLEKIQSLPQCCFRKTENIIMKTWSRKQGHRPRNCNIKPIIYIHIPHDGDILEIIWNWLAPWLSIKWG